MVETQKTFVALVIYPTTPLSQSGQADILLRMAGPSLRAMPGFTGGQLFLSEDGESVVSVVEWRDRDSFLKFRQTDFIRGTMELLAGDVPPRPYWLKPYATLEP